MTSPHRLITPIKSAPTLAHDAKGLLGNDGRESGRSDSSPIAAKASLDTDEASSSKGADGASKSDKPVQGNQKTIVDQRTTDAGSVRITVIAYSDGSSDTLREIKDQGFSSLAGAKPQKPLSPSDKGLVLDKLG